jgi:hypothetical protein
MNYMIEITQAMYDRAHILAEAQGRLKGSIRFGAGNIYGYLGEEIFCKAFECQRVNDYEHDFVINRFDKDIRIDVKTKMTTVEPKPEYEASVTKMPKQQDTDIYFFCRVHKDTRKGWLIGWEWSDIFFLTAYLKNKGDKDTSNSNICKRTCWNIFHHQLQSPWALCSYIGDRTI